MLARLLEISGLVPTRGELPHRVKAEILGLVLKDSDILVHTYSLNKDALRRSFETDPDASDVVAFKSRQRVTRQFRHMLEDDGVFAQVKQSYGVHGDEQVWQRFFEDNPWVLGVGLSGQLLTSWNNDKLEQVVAGYSIAGPGKRADGLLRTAGIISSMVFAEFKHHHTPLLSKEYRSGCWAPSDELAGGVAQAQGTVHRATRQIGDRICGQALDGSDIPGDFTYLVQPRSFLVVGTLEEFRGMHGGDHQDKIRSFQLLRRNTHSPEIITFDELLARAEWMTENGPHDDSESTDDEDFLEDDMTPPAEAVSGVTTWDTPQQAPSPAPKNDPWATWQTDEPPF